jgi:cyclohexyl-isocyanide hydratase
MGIEVVTDRVVFEDPFVSGAGVSAGIDMALALTARVHGDKLAKTLELAIESDPQPPFDAGAPEKVDASTLARSRPDAGQAPPARAYARRTDALRTVPRTPDFAALEVAPGPGLRTVRRGSARRKRQA